MSFYARITDQVSKIKDRFNYPNEGTAFGHFVLKECFKKIIDFDYDGSDFDHFIFEHIVDKANDLGNDAVFVNNKNKSIMIFQFKYSENPLLYTEDIKKNKSFINWLLNSSIESLKPNGRLKKIIESDIYPLIRCGEYSFILYYIDANFDERIKTDIKSLYNNYFEKNIDLQIRFYSHHELEEIFDDIEIPKNKIELKIIPDEYFEKELRYHDTVDTDIKVLVTSFCANSLKPVVEDKKELIYALNVRYYKGENDINLKIKKEYAEGKRSNFWILNNGINAICTDYKIIGDRLIINDFQIVNGCQTSKTLTRILNDLPDEVQILMRLSKILDKTRAAKISKAISLASNNQNAITQRDLHSGDRLQTVIFTRLDEANVFYDRKDGEWSSIINKNKYKSALHKGYEKINNTELGKAYLSFYLQLPISTKGRDKLVFSEEYYSEIFNQNISEDEQFLKLIFAYRISEIVLNIKAKHEANYEVLENSYINDVLVSLAALYFLKEDLSLLDITKVKDYISVAQIGKYIDKNDKYNLSLEADFEPFILKMIRILQNVVDVMKEAKFMYDQKWYPKDLNNWLKKDGTYKIILEKVKIKFYQL